MATQGYEAVWVKPDTKKRLKILAVTEDKTLDEQLEKLLNFYQANT